MITQPPQYTTALSLTHFSDTCDIPFQPVATSGTITIGGSFLLSDGSAFFIQDGINVGMIVWNTTTGDSATIVAVIGEKELSIDADIFPSGGDGYTIFSSPNPGCLIYVGQASDSRVKVTTQGGDVVVFYGLNSGAVLPVRVLRVWETDTSATSLIALW
jgi:hypothetical protein